MAGPEPTSMCFYNQSATGRRTQMSPANYYFKFYNSKTWVNVTSNNVHMYSD